MTEGVSEGAMTDQSGPTPPVRTGCFEETPGQRSMMRWSCVLCIVWGALSCPGGAVVAVMKETTQALTILTIGISMIGTGLGGNMVQKFAENKETGPQSEGA